MSNNKQMAKFGEFTVEDAERAVKEASTGGNFAKIEPGKNVFRFLPPRPGESAVMVTNQHWVPNTETGKNVTFYCPRAHFKKKCPLCIIADRMNRSNSVVDQNKSKDLFPRKSVMSNVINRASQDDGPMVLRYGWGVLSSLKGIRSNDESGGDFTNPLEAGFDIVITKSGQGLKTEYEVLPSRKSSVLHSDPTVWQEWVDAQVDLRQLVRLKTEEEIMDLIGLDEQDVYGREAQPAKAQLRPARTIQDDAEDAEYEEAKK